MGNVLKAKFGSLKVAVVALFFLWMGAYLLGLGNELIERPEVFLTALPVTILLGWLILPQNLLHNLWGLTYESIPEWLQFCSLLGYWLLVLALKITFFLTRRWWVFVVLAVVVLTSAHGCMEFVAEQTGDMG
jgi:hypothetical protein